MANINRTEVAKYLPRLSRAFHSPAPESRSIDAESVFGVNDRGIEAGETGETDVHPDMNMDIRLSGCNLSDKKNTRRAIFIAEEKSCESLALANEELDIPYTKTNFLMIAQQFPTDGSYRLCISKIEKNQNGTFGFIDVSKSRHANDRTRFISVSSPPRVHVMPKGIQIAVVSVLLIFSGLFSGLNLGLMSLDISDLQIIMKSGKKQEKHDAETIFPIRKTGNYLLCTLLFGNVIVNAAISILFDDLTSGLIALVASSMGIVIFGEILPQAICSRYGLAAGAKTIWLTKFFMVITFPLSYPVSRILNCVLGDEVGKVYSKERLLELIRQQQQQDGELKENQEVQIISGALALSSKAVNDVMTHIRDVYSIRHDAKLDSKLINEIVESGYTRIPVTEGERTDGTLKIVGLLNVKDLALLDPEDHLAVRTVLQFYQHPVRTVLQDMPLMMMLDEFKKGHYHMAFVERVQNESGDTDPFYELVGLVTLEDIIEEIIQCEILDETDRITDNRQRVPRRTHKVAVTSVLPTLPVGADVDAPTQQPVVGSGGGGQEMSHINPHLATATYQFLVANFTPLGPELISEPVLNRVIRQNVVRRFAPTDKAIFLYEKGKPADYFLLVLQGIANVCIGQESNEFEAGSFHSFGKQILNQMATLAPKMSANLLGNKGGPSSPTTDVHKVTFVPDYTVRVKERDEVTYLVIRARTYLFAYRATLLAKSRGKVLDVSPTEEVPPPTRSKSVAQDKAPLIQRLELKKSEPKKKPPTPVVAEEDETQKETDAAGGGRRKASEKPPDSTTTGREPTEKAKLLKTRDRANSAFK